MRLSRTELLAKIRLGEDSSLKFREVYFAGSKITGPLLDDLANELAAFANGSGGLLVLGVDDKRRVVTGISIEKLDAVEALVRQACEAIEPSLAPTIEKTTLPDQAGLEQPVIRVDVARSLFVHMSPGGYFRRVGSLKRPIPPDQLARLFQQRNQSRLFHFDQMPAVSSSMSDLEQPLWRRFVPPESQDAPEILLNKLAMAAMDDDGQWYPTVAGLLMGSRVAHRYLPNAFIQAVAYKGITVVPEGDSIYQLDACDFTGSLDQQILGACAFVRKNMTIATFKHAQGRHEDIPQYDMQVVFEAVTNAVAHRDYSIAGSKVRLRLFEDRLELYSPGMLSGTMEPDQLRYRQAVRNEAITSLLARCKVEDAMFSDRKYFMERRGEGVPIILDKSRRLSGKSPEYRLVDSSELMLTIFAAGKKINPC
jgi:predicted HTH transcriptional regulator